MIILFFLLYLVETIVNIFYLSLYEFLGISTVIIFPAFVSALICFSIERLYKKQQFAIHNNNILDDNFINNKPDVNNE